MEIIVNRDILLNWGDYMLKILSYVFFISSMILLISLPAFAEEVEENLLEKLKLIENSQRLTEEEFSFSSSALSLYLSNYHSGENEFNLGGKYERDFFPKKAAENLNLRYVLEGIYLEGEENISGYLSLKLIFNNNVFAPYFGAGAEFVGRADYQAFLGLNLNDNFFVESKFINDEDDLNKGDFYTVFGFIINL